jgi:hypothetical protein
MLYLQDGALSQYVFSLVITFQLLRSTLGLHKNNFDNPSCKCDVFHLCGIIVSLESLEGCKPFLPPGLPEECGSSELPKKVSGYKSVGLRVADHLLLPLQIHSKGCPMKKLIHLESTNQRWRIRWFKRMKKRKR